MNDQTTPNRTTAEQTRQTTAEERTTRGALWVVLAVSISVPLGGAITGYLLAPGFSVLDPFFLFFSLVSLASALLGAAGTTLLLTR